MRRVIYSNVKFLILIKGFVLLICSSNCNAQEAYEINWNNEWKYWSGIFGANAIAYGLFSSTEPLTYEQWIELDSKNINSFDRTSLNRQSKLSSNLSDYFSNGTIALPLMVYISKGWDPKWWESSIMFAEVMALNASFINISKYGFKRPRPFVYSRDLKPGESLGRSDMASFISGHTSFAAGNSFFAAAIFQKAYPESKLVPWVYLSAATIPAITGIQRIEAGKHFPTDVIAGYLVGTMAATIVIQVHRRDHINLVSGNGQVGLLINF